MTGLLYNLGCADGNPSGSINFALRTDESCQWGTPSRPQEQAPWVASLMDRLDSLQREYSAWRQGEPDADRLAENVSWQDKLSQLRRQIASAQAAGEDFFAKMRLLDNWGDRTAAGKAYEFLTPQGSYELKEHAVTHVWLVRTPDGALEGPFADAQEGADWAADDWDENFIGQEVPAIEGMSTEEVAGIRATR